MIHSQKFHLNLDKETEKVWRQQWPIFIQLNQEKKRRLANIYNESESTNSSYYFNGLLQKVLSYVNKDK